MPGTAVKSHGFYPHFGFYASPGPPITFDIKRAVPAGAGAFLEIYLQQFSPTHFSCYFPCFHSIHPHYIAIF